MTRRNRRIVVPRYGGPDVMTVIEEPLPEPNPGEVRVRILVAGVGYPEVLIREGTHRHAWHVVRMPSSVPHAVRAPERARMLLLMLRDAAGADR